MHITPGKNGQVMVGAVGKYHTVKSAVDYVAKGAGQDKGCAKFKSLVVSFSGKKKEVNHDSQNRHYTENAEKQFTPLAGKLQAKGHAVVFGKIEFKPITDNRHLFAQRKVQFNPNLKPLV